MSVEKMRQEFEATYVTDLVSRCGEGFRDTALYSLSERKPDGSYQHYTDSIAWWAWRASRAALVIELPDVEVFGSGVDDFALSPTKVREAIETAGLKVK